MTVQIMAIVNTSPDSFSGDGLARLDEIEARLNQVIEDGADLIDIGGQSTRPGAEVIDEAQELQRVVPAVRLARSRTKLPISVDTFKPAVAEAAISAGADIINDIHGCQDPQMVRLVRDHGVRVVVMHSRGDSKTMAGLTEYPEGLMPALLTFFEERLRTLQAAGIKREQIIIDPGIGFAKTGQQCFEITKHLERLAHFGVPLLYAASQKSFIGKALADENGAMAPVADRAVGTMVANTFAMLHGADIVREHDVRAAVQARTVVEAILNPTQVRG